MQQQRTQRRLASENSFADAMASHDASSFSDLQMHNFLQQSSFNKEVIQVRYVGSFCLHHTECICPCNQLRGEIHSTGEDGVSSRRIASEEKQAVLWKEKKGASHDSGSD